MDDEGDGSSGGSCDFKEAQKRKERVSRRDRDSLKKTARRLRNALSMVKQGTLSENVRFKISARKEKNQISLV